MMEGECIEFNRKYLILSRNDFPHKSKSMETAGKEWESIDLGFASSFCIICEEFTGHILTGLSYRITFMQ
jgi:hypothetical protein